MERFRPIVTGMCAIAVVAVLTTPAFAGKTVLEDEEMDEVTAAGQPKITQARTTEGTAEAVNFQVNVFAAHIGGQEELTALTLNNIFGENQVANAVNIQSGADNEGSQANNIVQSWGSAKAHASVLAPGAPGGAAACGAAGIIAKCTANGGDASDPKIGILWEFADEIAGASNENGPAFATNVVVNVFAGTFDEFAQSGLTALTVNNIVGFNQVANGLNISAGGVNGTTIEGAGVGSATGQNNTIEQWRGAPKGWNQAPTFF